MILKKIFSMKVAVVLMLIFAVAIGIATFIENDYGTQTARALIYNAKWFELLLIYFTATVVYNIFQFKMYRKEKWGQLVLHIAFVLIALGAGITRYIGYEGILHLREHQESNMMVSDIMMLEVGLKDGNNTRFYDEPMILSSMTKNHFKKHFSIHGKGIDVELLDYLPSASQKIVSAPDGTTILQMKLSGGSMGEDVVLKKGDSKDMGTFLVSFEGKRSSIKPTIYLYEDNSTLMIDTPVALNTLKMADRSSGKIEAGKHKMDKRVLYQFTQNSIVLREIYPKAKIKRVSTAIKPGGKNPQEIKLKITHNNKSQIISLQGRQSIPGKPHYLNFDDGLGVRLSYGAKIIELPFSIKLDDFELQRYPGSMSPSSYSSYVEVIDKQKGVNMKYHIYMNHVLDYRGYRFFQSSFDADEKGSILSVNHDPGTLPTYLGYLLLAIGFLWSFVSPKGRFQHLRKKLHKIRSVAPVLVALLFGIYSPTLQASDKNMGITDKEFTTITSYDKDHSLEFGKLVVQGSGGRMKPMDTLSHEILSKIARKSTLFGLNADQVVLGMLTHPEIYQKLKFIKISHPLIAKKMGLPKDTKYVSYNDFFKGKNKEYIFANEVQSATRKKPSAQSKYEKELIKADERLNVAYMTFNGTLFKVFPKPNDKNNRWYDPISAMKNFPPKEGQMVRVLLATYFTNVNKALTNNSWKDADKALEFLKKYQYYYGKEVIPSQDRINMEIEYNKLDIFNRLTLVYILVGLLLLILSFVNIVKPKFSLKWPVRVSLAILGIAFFAQTAGLGLRWYIAQHAPWSNAYESIIYISWATVLAGFVFAKRSPITLAATSILAGIFLFVAHLNWLDPQITNLVPVLKSYWLMIHVAVITASYGFLGLGALLGMFTLLLFIIRGKDGNENIDRAIKELTYINEMTLLIGLALVTVGNFLGGVWANESWGRYWGWDPKETWAAVTILVYAAVVHMRFIPKLYTIYSFNVAAILAYSSVIMTYFGVNYYLSGMHSYAAGDPVPIPGWVWPAIASVFALILLAYRNKELK